MLMCGSGISRLICHSRHILWFTPKPFTSYFWRKFLLCKNNLDKKLHKISITNSFNFLQSRSFFCLWKLNFAVKLCFVGINISFNCSEIIWVNIYQIIENIIHFDFYKPRSQFCTWKNKAPYGKMFLSISRYLSTANKSKYVLSQHKWKNVLFLLSQMK